MWSYCSSFSLQWVTGKWDSFLKALTPLQASKDYNRTGAGSWTAESSLSTVWGAPCEATWASPEQLHVLSPLRPCPLVQGVTPQGAGHCLVVKSNGNQFWCLMPAESTEAALVWLSCLGMHVPSHGSLTLLPLLRASLVECLQSLLGCTLTQTLCSKNSTVIKVLLLGFFNATVVSS